jgi:aryl-alcohol dehydrogenase-like predicted oxidoreductase
MSVKWQIKFCEIQTFVTSVIIGATKMDQLEINLKSHEIDLDEEAIKDINKIQEIYSNPCP